MMVYYCSNALTFVGKIKELNNFLKQLPLDLTLKELLQKSLH